MVCIILYYSVHCIFNFLLMSVYIIVPTDVDVFDCYT